MLDWVLNVPLGSGIKNRQLVFLQTEILYKDLSSNKLRINAFKNHVVARLERKFLYHFHKY